MELTEKQKVRISMIGADDYMSVSGTFHIIQDAVTDLLCLHDLSAPTLRNKYNAIWLFVKTKVKFIKRLCCQDPFTVRAFFSHISLAQMHVDVQIEDANGAPVLYSRTVVCALDVEKQRIRKLSTVGMDTTMTAVAGGTNANIEFTDFDETGLPSVDSVRVKSTNIDMSHHTNNAEYVRIIMNTYSVAETQSMQIKEMELQYVGQSFENDILDIRKAVVGNEHRIVLKKGGSTVIICKIVCQ